MIKHNAVRIFLHWLKIKGVISRVILVSMPLGKHVLYIFNRERPSFWPYHFFSFDIKRLAILYWGKLWDLHVTLILSSSYILIIWGSMALPLWVSFFFPPSFPPSLPSFLFLFFILFFFLKKIWKLKCAWNILGLLNLNSVSNILRLILSNI